VRRWQTVSKQYEAFCVVDPIFYDSRYGTTVVVTALRASRSAVRKSGSGVLAGLLRRNGVDAWRRFPESRRLSSATGGRKAL
jgi:hypothetical protein